MIGITVIVFDTIGKEATVPVTGVSTNNPIVRYNYLTAFDTKITTIVISRDEFSIVFEPTNQGLRDAKNSCLIIGSDICTLQAIKRARDGKVQYWDLRVRMKNC